MRKIATLLCSVLLLCGVAKGRNYDAGGVVIDPSTITAFDIFNSAHTQFNTITARSAAMAGAMTSLGADASSMSINPAGLGMYQTNELTFTPMMSFTRSKTNAQSFGSNNKNRFAVGNLGFVVKLRESSTGVTAVNMGLSYNRLADYNYRYSLSNAGFASNASIADVYAGQLTAGGITSAQLKKNYDGFGNFLWSSYDPTYWGAILGYKTGLVNDASGRWGRDMLTAQAQVGSAAVVESKGSAGEWVWSLGINFNSKFYLGMSLAATVINQQKSIYYGEEYRYASEPQLNYRMDYFNYDQQTRSFNLTFTVRKV